MKNKHVQGVTMGVILLSTMLTFVACGGKTDSKAPAASSTAAQSAPPAVTATAETPQPASSSAASEKTEKDAFAEYDRCKENAKILICKREGYKNTVEIEEVFSSDGNTLQGVHYQLVTEDMDESSVSIFIGSINMKYKSEQFDLFTCEPVENHVEMEYLTIDTALLSELGYLGDIGSEKTYRLQNGYSCEEK